MFGVEGGFDVVLGNPPYINVENLSADMRSYLLSNYATCEGRTDIYIAFCEKGLDLLNDSGSLCFILSSAFATRKYGTKMRQKLVEQHTIHQFVDATAYRIFENAVVYNVVLLAGKGKQPGLTQVRLHRSNADFDHRAGVEFSVDQSFFASLKDCRFDSNPHLAACVKVKEKLWAKAIRFDRICFVAYGARLNHRFEKLGKEHYLRPSPAAGDKPFCEGKSIERYSVAQEGWLNYAPQEHNNPMFPELFENEKLMFISVVKDRLRFAYDDRGFYNSHTVTNCVRLDLLAGATHRSAVAAWRGADTALARQYDYKFLLGVLNSQLINWYFRSFLGGTLHLYPNDAKELPIPSATPEQQAPVIRLVERILAAKAADPGAVTAAWEGELDGLVYGLYGLSGEEVGVVESLC